MTCKHCGATSKKSQKTIAHGKKLYEGKSKIIFSTPKKDVVLMHFKDDATAFNAKKRGTIVNKGVLNNYISAFIYSMLEKHGVKTHLIERISARDQMVYATKIIPIEVVIRNVVAGSLSKRMGIPEGTPLKMPVLELFYKSDELDDPMINENHALAFNLATPKQIDTMKRTAIKVNKILVPFFKKRGIKLIDYKLEFGLKGSQILLADEISPDGCRLWDAKTNEKMDKDRFRRDLGKIEESYAEVFKRVTGKSAAEILKKSL